MGHNKFEDEIYIISREIEANDVWERQYQTIMRRLIRKSHNSLLVRRALIESWEAVRSLEEYRLSNQSLSDENHKLKNACVDLAMHASETKLELYKLKRKVGEL